MVAFFLRPRRRCVFAVACLLAWISWSPGGAEAQSVTPGIEDYLPSGTAYDVKVPTPEKVLGWQVGERHVRHDQLVTYMRRLAATSPRVRLDVIGHSHEHRELVQLVISSPQNLERLDDILAAQQTLRRPSDPPTDLSQLPIVVNLGYSVHGNEASGSNASLLVAYYLAAAYGEEVESWLDQAVIVLDPSLNPDGMARFAQWVNMHRGRVLVADPQHREHREAWPNGRTNHYWFDLNRDWLLGQHPETQARLARFHQFQPTVLTDFHEMGTQSTYFFQPGIPSRRNPLTPERNVELTQDIADFHAQALDDIGSLYYAEESFDDFYYGKGSTYPDIQGAIGILFEQASARGHVQETKRGPLTFAFAIRNQVRTSLSTLRGAVNKRQELLQYRRDFYRQSLDLAGQDAHRGWVFGDAEDPARTFHMAELLRRHRIEVHLLSRDMTLGAYSFKAGKAWVVANEQPQYRLLHTLFEQRVDFPDNTFYDVSTWTLPLAFDMPYAAVPAGFDVQSMIDETSSEPSFPSVKPELPIGGDDTTLPYAYAFSWRDFYAPRALGRLLRNNLHPNVATRSFTVEGPDGDLTFEAGAIVLPTARLALEPRKLHQLLARIARQDGVRIHPIKSGQVSHGVDLGSPSMWVLEAPRIGLVVGRHVDTYAAGEIWHLLDQRFELPVTLLEIEDLPALKRYNQLIMVDGDYDTLSERDSRAIATWVKRGGTLITIRRGASWAEDNVLVATAEDSEKQRGSQPDIESRAGTLRAEPPPISASPDETGASDVEPVERLPYGDAEKRRAEQLISGTIFAVDLDLTHPLAYGYGDRQLPVFRNHRVLLRPSNDPYATVAAYLSSPLLSGFVSDDNLARLRQAPAVIAERHGKGVVIRIADDPNFRAYWYGTNRLMLNAIFFGPELNGNGRR